MSKLKVIGQFFKFLTKGNKYVLAPLYILLVLLALLAIIGEGSVIAPLIYSLF